MKIAIIINDERMTPGLKSELEANNLAEKYQIQHDVFSPKPEELTKTLENLQYDQYTVIVIGGGDGTVRSAVQVLIDKEVPLAIMTLGTFNVLGKSLNHSSDLESILQMIKNKKYKQIDVAEVNGNVIVNHAWLGIYYNILKEREKHKEWLRKSRLLKAIFNTLFLFKRVPYYYFEVKLDDKRIAFKTCLLFIANNDSSANWLNFGERIHLSSGLFSISILNCHTRWQLFRCMLHIIFGDFKQSKYISHFRVNELKVDSSKEHINIVIDGELFKLKTPLHFVIHQRQLTVAVP